MLATGRRESTYKLVTLLALIHYATEWCPNDDGPLDVDLLDIAERVSRLYRPSLEPYQDRSPLSQVKRDSRVTMLKHVAKIDDSGPSVPELRSLAQHIAQQPLTHLQNDGRLPTDDFLFNSSWLHKKVTQSELDDHDWRIKLLPGVAPKLAQLAPMLIPVVERLWVTEVLRFNPSVAEAQVEAYLLGGERRPVTRLAPILLDVQDRRCFYCAEPVGPANVHVDHVLPWTRCGFDGISNLVAADAACNLSKSDSLPDPAFIRKALRRPYLDEVCTATEWRHGVDAERMRRTAIGQFRFLPNHYRLWKSRTQSTLVTASRRSQLIAQLL